MSWVSTSFNNLIQTLFKDNAICPNPCDRDGLSNLIIASWNFVTQKKIRENRNFLLIFSIHGGGCLHSIHGCWAWAQKQAQLWLWVFVFVRVHWMLKGPGYHDLFFIFDSYALLISHLWSAEKITIVAIVCQYSILTILIC